jgi:hypothetical protein
MSDGWPVAGAAPAFDAGILSADTEDALEAWCGGLVRAG